MLPALVGSYFIVLQWNPENNADDAGMQYIDIDLSPFEPGLAGPDFSAIRQVSMGRAASGFSSYFSNVRKLIMWCE